MGNWKAVQPGGQDDRLELYNLANDMGEENNLANLQPQIIAKIKTIIEELTP